MTAPCLGLGALFFSFEADDQWQAAQACAACPDRRECGEGALARREPWGVWGGLVLPHGQPAVPPSKRGPAPGSRTRPINHGTRGGAEAHRLRGVAMCGPCAEADAAYHRARYEAKRAAS